MVDSGIFATDSDLICNINTEDLIAIHSPSELLETFSELNALMPHPEHWNKFPNMDDVTTRYELDMHMDPGDNPNWLYNVKQNKVFIKVNSVMTLTFTYKPFDATNLFLRAMLVYTSPDDMHLDIKRCANHRETSNNLHTEVPPAHILKCCHPHAKYVGVENQKLFGERLSVVLPLGRPALNEKGEAIESTMWTFLCQNSCTNGMNRKSTAVIFTLENDLYEIIGKQVMRFKVCSCPKRDNQREDPSARTLKREKKAPEGKRPTKVVCLPAEVKVEPHSPPVESCKLHSSHTVTLTMPHRDSMKHVLRCALNEVAGVKARDQTGQCRCFEMFSDKIEGLLTSL